MPLSFDACFARVLGVEGDFSDDPSDSGGATRYGITEHVARSNGYTGDMRELPLDVAKRIYRREYWDRLSLDAVALLSSRIAEELFDTAVNCGQGVAGTWLQRCLNVLNREQKDYADLVVDGAIGSRSVEALGAYLAHRKPHGERVLLRALNALQGAHYIVLAEKRVKDEAFVNGWFLNRVVI